MNLVLLRPEDFAADDRVRIGGRALVHIRQVLRKDIGDVIRVGKIGGRIGRATIVAIDSEAAELDCVFDRDPPPKSRVTLVIALPRPPMLRRILQHATTMGVPQIVLVQAARVEKSFWSSHDLLPDNVTRQLELGLEQAGDTILPVVHLRRRFRPFVEDELADVVPGAHRLLAQAGDAPSPAPAATPIVLFVGPEGGWVPFELDRLHALGCADFSLGPRVLRVETAVVAALARLG